MSERSIETRYYGVPEGERAGLAKKREKEVGNVDDETERNGLGLPEKYLGIAKAAADAIAMISGKYLSTHSRLSVERVYFMPDQSMGSDPNSVGTFFGPTGTIEIRLSELFDVPKQELVKRWDAIQDRVRESYRDACSTDFNVLANVPFETKVVIVLMSLFRVDELSESLWDIPKDVGSLRRTADLRLSAYHTDPRVVGLATKAMDALFSETVIADDLPFIVNAKTGEKRAVYRVMRWGRVARRMAGQRAAQAAIEYAESHRVDAVVETLTHELVHAAAPNFIAEFPDGMDTRSGYRVPSKKLGEKSRFRSLNEACTETIALRAMTTPNPSLDEGGETRISDGLNFFEADGAYTNDRLLLQAIVRGIAKATDETETVRWERFERGYFTGGLMVLRDIEKEFGREAWDYYKQLNPDKLRKPSRATRQMIKKYFGLRLPA